MNGDWLCATGLPATAYRLGVLKGAPSACGRSRRAGRSAPFGAAVRWRSCPGIDEIADAADVAEHLKDVNMEQLTISDIALDDSQSRVTIRSVPDRPGIAALVFEEVAAAGVFVDMIVQSHKGRNGVASLSFTVPRTQLDKALGLAERLGEVCELKRVTSSRNVAKLSVSGIGLRSHTDVAIRMFRALAEQGVNVEMINTSEVRVNVVVNSEKGQIGLAALQRAFADVRL
jgi:aspartate kinase